MKVIFSVIILVLFMATALPGVSAGKVQKKESFRIHEASFKTPSKAAQEVSSLKSKGYRAYYRKVSIPGKGTWYRVYIGQYASRDDAMKAARDMKQKHTIDYAAVERSAASAGRDIAPASPIRKEAKAAPVKASGTDSAAKKKTAGRVSRDSGRTNGGKTPSAPVAVPPKGKTAAAPGQGHEAPKGAAVPTATPSVQESKPSPPPEPPSSDPLFNAAMGDFRAGRYENALAGLKKLYTGQSSDPHLREKVTRRLGDTHYFLGVKNGKQDYFNAVDYYKEVLERYPDVREGNDEVYYRLARSYEYLNFFYEAYRALEKLITRYPESAYAPDALFMTADIFNRLGKLQPAIDNGLAYLKKYPDGPHAKKVHFIVADCYYRLNQYANADVWYGQALKKWADLSDVPKFMMLDLGYHYYRSRRFSEANDIFSYYISLYPTDPWARMAMLALGRSLAEMDQTPLALKVFGRVIEKYPESGEAKEAAVAMANLGVNKPGLKVPAFTAAIDNYREPIAAYDKLLDKEPNGDMAEQILALKGHGLVRGGRYREAFDTYAVYLKKYPWGKYLQEVLKGYRVSATQLVETYYGKGDDVAVADLYYATASRGLTRSIDGETLFKMGNSLKKIGLYDDATLIYNDLIKSAGNTRDENRVILAMAETDMLRGRNKDADQKLQSILKQTRRRDKALIEKAKIMMAEVAYRQGLYDRAIQSYRGVLGSAEKTDEGLSIYDKYANALKEQNRCKQAVTYYQKIIASAGKDGKRYPPRLVADAYMGLADCFIAEKRFKEGMAMYRQAITRFPEQGSRMWSIYRVGRQYYQRENYPEADKAFELLKTGPDGAFWSKVIEYQTEDGKWSAKYLPYPK